jgi:hypothetical protein
MADKQQKNQPSWARASPLTPNLTRLTSPGPQNPAPRHRSPTPTFNARQLVNPSPFHPVQPSPVPMQRSGFTTVYDSQRDVPMSPVNFSPDAAYPRPFRGTFSPTQSVSTRASSIPTPLSMEYHHGQSQQQQQQKGTNDFYVVPLEPANLQNKNLVICDDEDDGRPSTASIIAQQSQDYVDEKLAEYQATITYLQGKSTRESERERTCENQKSNIYAQTIVFRKTSETLHKTSQHKLAREKERVKLRSQIYCVNVETID